MLRRHSVTLAIAAALAAVFGAALWARQQYGIPFAVTMGDPATVAGEPFYIGFVSNVGVLLWAATGCIFLFTHSVLRGCGEAQHGSFLLASGLFVAWLGLDDLFLLHEVVLPDYLGVPQMIVGAAYGAVAFAYLAVYRRHITAGPSALLIAALALLATSLAVDQGADLLDLDFTGLRTLEDAPKLAGIGAWLAYAVHTCMSAIRAARVGH